MEVSVFFPSCNKSARKEGLGEAETINENLLCPSMVPDCLRKSHSSSVSCRDLVHPLQESHLGGVVRLQHQGTEGKGPHPRAIQ